MQNLKIVETVHDFLQFSKSDPDSVHFESPYPNSIPDTQFLLWVYKIQFALILWLEIFFWFPTELV